MHKASVALSKASYYQQCMRVKKKLTCVDAAFNYQLPHIREQYYREQSGHISGSSETKHSIKRLEKNLPALTSQML